jgi:hypothetical protein
LPIFLLVFLVAAVIPSKVSFGVTVICFLHGLLGLEFRGRLESIKWVLGAFVIDRGALASQRGERGGRIDSNYSLGVGALDR